MQRLAFVASFLAAFITLDLQFFDGGTTREGWHMMMQASQATEMHFRQWMRLIGRQ